MLRKVPKEDRRAILLTMIYHHKKQNSAVPDSPHTVSIILCDGLVIAAWPLLLPRNGEKENKAQAWVITVCRHGIFTGINTCVLQFLLLSWQFYTIF